MHMVSVRAMQTGTSAPRETELSSVSMRSAEGEKPFLRLIDIFTHGADDTAKALATVATPSCYQH